MHNKNHVNYLSNIYVTTQTDFTENIEIYDVSFSEAGDFFTLDVDALRRLQTQSIGNIESHSELDPDTINGEYTYPYKVKVPKLIDSSSLIYVPGVDTFPTASQYYYAPIVFDRYNPVIMRGINKNFEQLTVDTIELSSGGE